MDSSVDYTGKSSALLRWRLTSSLDDTDTSSALVSASKNFDVTRGWSSGYSCFTIEEPLDRDRWRKLMDYLESTDVSKLQHLKVLVDRRSRSDSWFVVADTLHGDSTVMGPKLSTVLGTGRFSALKKLEIDVSESWLLLELGLGSASLAEVFRKGKLTNLCELHLRVSGFQSELFHVDDIFEALVKEGFTQLTSLFIDGPLSRPVDQKLAALLNSECLRNLRHLTIRYFNGLEWTVLANAVKSGLLPNLISLVLSCVYSSKLLRLADLVEGPGNWFSSLEILTVSECQITSEQVCAFVDAIIKLSKSKFALKVLNLSSNKLDGKAVDGLERLVNSGCLPQLEELDLSGNWRLGDVLPWFMETIQRGHLPGLKKLDWRGNNIGSNDEGAKAVAQSYLENKTFTAEIYIDWDSVRDPSLNAKVKKYKERNDQLVGLMNEVEEKFKDLVPLNSAKIFLCGYPRVGKTTLRKALRRHLDIATRLFEGHSKLFKEPRTKGIELSRIRDENNTSLTFWDLAGQEEFHVLHGAFLADLGSVGSLATIFLLVFKVPFETPFKKNVEAKLLYWLKFVASGSVKHVKRQVLIVLNRFDGKRCSDFDKDYWMGLIDKFAAQFTDVLHIHSDPFIIDVRFAESVLPLKSHLFLETRRLLKGVEIPKACFELLNELNHLTDHVKPLEDLKGLSKGTNRGGNQSPLPIFTWKAFEGAWESKNKIEYVPTKNLKICASYLHEIGEIIYFDRIKPIEPESESRTIVVADAEWFCKEVVGRLLLPKYMQEEGRFIEVSADGSISLFWFRSFFQHLLPSGTQSDDVVSMLEQVGLCYRKGTEEIIVPALIRKDDYKKLDWEHQGFHGVMGRSLATEEKDRSAIPDTLFRHLQVELAQDPSLGGRGESEYRAGKSFLHFKHGELLILVQFDVDHSDPSDDRIDVLVKSLLPDVSSAKVNCVCEIMHKLERLCHTWCPGLEYDVKVIRPWNADEKTPEMTERQMTSLTEVKALLVKGDKYSSWKLNGYPVELKTLVSEIELKRVLGTAERDYDECKRDAVSWGLLTEDSLEKLEEFEQQNGLYTPSSDCPNDDGPDITNRHILNAVRQQHDLTRKAVHYDGHLTRQYIKNSYQVLLLEIRHKQNALVRHIQAQQEFSIEETDKSVPRYIFLSRKQGKSSVWITPREALNNSFELHFLCEAHFDHGSFHEVVGQEGIQLTKSREWLVKISPWLRRSLQVAIMVGKTVGNVYLPGVFNFIPDLNYLQDEREGSSKAVDTAATMMWEEDKEFNHVQGDHSNYGTAAQPVDLRERMIAEGVVKDLIGDLREATFIKKIGLRKVQLLRETTQPHMGSSMQAQFSEAQSSVRWICHSCYKCYGNTARVIAK